MKVTLDTNFLVSATQWDYSVAHKLLKRMLREKIQIYLSDDIINEFTGILKRDFERSDEDIDTIIQNLTSFANIVDPLRKIEYINEDPPDDRILECAVESDSDYILTYNKHLLKIEEFEGIKIIKPEELLRVLNE